MMKKIIPTVLLTFLLFFIGGCSKSLTMTDPVPRRAMKEIEEIGTTTAYMEEFVGSAVIAEVILRDAAENRGTVGDVCEAVRLVEPGVQKQLALRTAGERTGHLSTSKALQQILDRLSAVHTMLHCETLNENS